MNKPGRLAVGVIGAGRAGAVVASALRAAGHSITGAATGSAATVERIDALLPGVPVLDPLAVAQGSDLVLLGVPDDALGAVVGWLAGQGGFRPGQLVVHLSGRHGTGVLRDAVAAGAIPIAIHPAMTFTGTSLDLARLEGTPFAVTAPAPVQPIGQALVVELGGEPILLAESARAGYHAALAHAGNHLVTLLVQAREILAAAAAQEDSGVERLLGPLTRAALEGALATGAGALTGPVSRGDVATVQEHLAVLDALGQEMTARSYRVLAEATARLAAAHGRLGPEQEAALLRLLQRAPLGAADNHPGRPARSGHPEHPGRPQPRVVRTIADLRAARALLTGTVAVVPTMGALHSGHLELVRAARQVADHVIVTVFVNPTQFGDPADLAAYPRTLEQDVAALAGLGPSLAPDLVLAPSAQEMYPHGPGGVTVTAGELGERYEGASRPGHFTGVLTVVSKLLHITTPDVAVFGEKDAQQLALVRAMVADLDWPVWVLAVPVVRDGDGLALSSRNARLSPEGREIALGLSRAVVASQRLARAGATLAQVVAAAHAELTDPGITVDYVAVVDERFEPASTTAGARLVLAAEVEGVRLLDTGELAAGGSGAS